jgi:hypothetical protein
VLGQLHLYGDWFRSNHSLGFYRGRSWPVQDFDDWSNQLVAKSPALFKPGSGSGLAAISYVKWSLLLNHVDRVFPGFRPVSLSHPVCPCAIARLCQHEHT